jgi:hypothetical protein
MTTVAIASLPTAVEVEQWRAVVKSDPRRILALATRALADWSTDSEPLTCDVSLVAAAAAHELDDVPLATRHARHALRIAQRLDDERRTGLALMALARMLTFAGAFDAAWRAAERALPLLDGHQLGMLHVQRMVVLYKLGRHPDALIELNRGLALVEDDLERAKALNNRGVLALYLGAFREGLADFDESERLYRANGLVVGAADAHHNRGMMLARIGDLPGALAAFDSSEAELDAVGVPTNRYVLAKAEVLVTANLLDDVRKSVPAAIESLEAAGMVVDAAEGHLLLAQALAAAADAKAFAEADAARRAFTANRRRGWAALARLAMVQAQYLRGEHTIDALRGARRAAAELARTGVHAFESEAVLMAGRLAAELGRRAEAERYLGSLAATSTRAPVSQRVLGYEADAVLRTLDGDRPGAYRAIDRGLRLLDEHRASMGATELRVNVSARGAALAALGVDLAFDTRRAANVLQWSERWRARSLWLRPVRPPDDAALAELLGELRAAHAALREAELEGGGDTATTARVAGLEEEIRRMTRRTGRDAGGGAEFDGRAIVARLRDTLGGRALVELVEHEGAVSAVVLTESTCRLVALGPAAPIARAGASLARTLRRLADARMSAGALEQLRGAADSDRDVLRQMVVVPVAQEIEDRDVVVVPVASLHALPWGALLDDRPVTICPSALLWRRATRTAASSQRIVVVAGPGLPGARDEVGRIAARYPESEVFTGAAATVANVGAAIDGAGLAHVAAHGTIRTDNPLFSAIELVDGPATVYDLEQLARPPAVLVLSTCNSAVNAVRAGDETIGLGSALLSLGTATVVSAVVPIPDADVVDIMDAFHQRLARGDAPARALHAARQVVDASQPAALAAAAAFVCVGAG